MNVKKGLGYAIITAGSVVAFVPGLAFADGAKPWSAPEMMNSAYAGSGSGAKVGEIDGAVISGWVGTFTSWALGIAIAIFVLKIVLTAIDRMLFASEGESSTHKVTATSGKTVLTRIPLVGAYDPTVDWKEVFIHFGKQLAIVVGAWIFVQLVVNLVMFAFGALNQ